MLLDLSEDQRLIVETVRKMAVIFRNAGDTDHATTLDGIVLELESGLSPALDLMPF